MTTKVQALTIITLGATLVIASAQTTQPAAAATAPPPPALSSTEQMIKDIKNPAKWMSWGADMRVRNEYFKDLLTLDPRAPLAEQDYFRFRARVWTSIKPVEDVSLNARLTAEPRYWDKPAGYTSFKGNIGMDWREGVFDNLNVNWTNIAGLPARIKVGRQDLRFSADPFPGDGWLIADATPNDGSWTFFFDSARFTYDLVDQHTKFEAIGIIQDAWDDGWMPTINNQNYLLTDQNEKGVIVQAANSSIKGVDLTGYFIYKNDSRVSSATGDNADIYTVGGRVNGMLDNHWGYWLEGAYQFGRKQDNRVVYPAPSSNYRTLNSYGLNSRVSYLFKDQYKNQLDLSFELLSGDDPNTGDDEMFDSLWGRWPRWSEIGLYSAAPEARIGQQANLIRLGPTWSLNPIQDMVFSASYYALFAMEGIATRGASPSTGPVFAGNAGLPGSGQFRGSYISASMDYKFSRHMIGQLWAEFQFPGNYYVNRDPMSFLRAQVMFIF